jgi:hypothetical protein
MDVHPSGKLLLPFCGWFFSDSCFLFPSGQKYILQQTGDSPYGRLPCPFASCTLTFSQKKLAPKHIKMHVQSHHIFLPEDSEPTPTHCIFLPEDSEPSNPSGSPIPGLISRSTQHIFLFEEQGSTPSDLVSEHVSDNGDDNTILSFLLCKPAPSVMVASAPTPTHLTLLTGLPTTILTPSILAALSNSTTLPWPVTHTLAKTNPPAASSS